MSEADRRRPPATARRRRAVLALAGLGATALLSACDGPQSILHPAGSDAAQLARLFWVMLAGAVVVWIALNGLFAVVAWFSPGKMNRWLAEGVIVGGGIVLPLIVLTTLLVYGLGVMPDQRAPGDGLRLHVTGEQWWWRVDYFAEGSDEPVATANEIRLPTGARSEIELSSERVIHSFWIPALGGKTDMFPGRVTRMSLEPTVPGHYRGQCAEFCGLSHALMAFDVHVMEPEAFNAWLAAEAQPVELEESAGARLFAAEGCGGCHRIRGTEWVSEVGPDLTHLGSRTTIAAGILPMDRDALVSWIRNPEAIKPGVEMPSYEHLDERALEVLASWLMELE